LELVNLGTQAKESIEVRSSFCYRLAPVEKIIEKLSVYGWYTSANKAAELPRDWYFQVIFYLRPRDISSDLDIDIGVFEDQLDSGSVTGYIVGGASRQLLHAEGVVRLDQDKASYQAISPIYRAHDCPSMARAILGRNPTAL
jgi:hypothetical protein